MRMKCLATLASAIATLTVVAVAGTVAPAQAQSAWEQIKSTGKYRIGVMPGRMPYMWQEKGSDEWHGFAIEMGRSIARSLSSENAMNRPITVGYVTTTWATVVLDIQANKLDSMLGMSITAKRKKAIDMFGPLYALAHVYINACGFEPGDTWKAYSDPKVRISTNMGSSDEDAIRRMSPKATVLAMRTPPEAILAVQAGRADAYGTSVLDGLNVMRKNPNFCKMVIPKPMVSLPSGGGARKDGDGRLAAFLQGWAWSTRTLGETKRLIMAASKTAGLNPKNIPPEMEF